MPNTTLHAVVLISLDLVPQAVLAFGPLMSGYRSGFSADAWGLPFTLVGEVVWWDRCLCLDGVLLCLPSLTLIWNHEGLYSPLGEVWVSWFLTQSLVVLFTTVLLCKE